MPFIWLLTFQKDKVIKYSLLKNMDKQVQDPQNEMKESYGSLSQRMVLHTQVSFSILCMSVSPGSQKIESTTLK